MSEVCLRGNIETNLKALPLFAGQQYTTQANLLEDEKQLFHLAQQCMERDLIARGYEALPLRATFVFLMDDCLSIDFCDPLTAGNAMHLIVYHVRRWREQRTPPRKILSIMIEEMCHCYYLISDEYDVKVRVTEVVQRVFPDVTFQDLFPKLPPPHQKQTRSR